MRVTPSVPPGIGTHHVCIQRVVSMKILGKHVDKSCKIKIQYQGNIVELNSGI